MKKTAFVLAFLIIALGANAQYVRSIFNASDLVIVGEVQWVADSEQGYFHTIGFDQRTSVEVREVRLRVLSSIKGQASGNISIALPKNFTWYDEPESPHTPTEYDVRLHKRAIWFLRRAPDGDFLTETLSNEDTYPMMWKAPGLQYSVTDLQGASPRWIPITRADVSEHSAAILKLADLFAENAAVSPSNADTFLNLLADMTPVPVQTIGYGKDIQGAELAEYMAWLNERFPVLFPQDAPWKRLSAMAVRMQWGQEELSQAFTNLYISAGPTALRCRFPQIPLNQDAIRLIPYVPTDLAGAIIRGLERDRADRIEITRLAVRRFGESHHLDGNILEALWKLWNREDLKPFGADGSLLDNLESRIALARRLVP